jgi:hypothetical protein
MNNNILIFTSTTLHNSPRIIKEINVLSEEFKIFAVGTSKYYDDTITSIPISKVKDNILDRVQKKIMNTFSNFSIIPLLYFKEKKIKKLLNYYKPKIVITHDPIYLPYLIKNKNINNYIIIYNAHEYHPLEYEDRVKWMMRSGKIYYNIYRKYLHQVDLLVNVSSGIAEKCLVEFGVESIIIPNVTNFININPVINSSDKIKIIHHGLPIKERQLEIMIKAVAQLDNKFDLDLMIVKGNDEYYKYIEGLVNATSNVKIIPTVEYKKIIDKLKLYDLGIYNLPPTSFNNKYALPNKFFEFIQARLCLLIGPSIEMKHFVEKYNLGIITNDFTENELVRSLKLLKKEDIISYKNNSHKAAEILCTEKYYEEYYNQIKAILN